MQREMTKTNSTEKRSSKFFILSNFECSSSFVFLYREQRHEIWRILLIEKIVHLILTYMSSNLSSDITFLFRVLQDSCSSISLTEMSGFHPLKKKDRPIEFISSSMIQDLWITVLRSTRNYYLLSSFLKESVSLIREYTVNFTQS